VCLIETLGVNNECSSTNYVGPSKLTQVPRAADAKIGTVGQLAGFLESISASHAGF